MAQSLAKLYVHLVFSTKNRTDTLPKQHLDEVHAYIAEDGYGAFSISQSHVDAVVNYIKGQEQHHHKVTFQEEFRRLCDLYDVELNEKYAWD